MKNFTILVLLILATTPVLAQFQLGGGLSYGVKASRPGATLKGLGTLSDQWKLSPGFTYYTNKSDINRGESLPFEDVNRLYSLDMDFHYQISLRHSRRITAYTITGVNFSFAVFNVEQVNALNQTSIRTETFNEVGINLGLGANYQLTKTSNLYYEAKIVSFSDAGQAVVNIGFVSTIGRGEE
ncbi:MAG: outer membrane beta-barrel protein [Bacteroidota bacterium]